VLQAYVDDHTRQLHDEVGMAFFGSALGQAAKSCVLHQQHPQQQEQLQHLNPLITRLGGFW
jgi:hypothetical protein